MKRTALLFLMVISLFALPALAELPEGYTPITVIRQREFLSALAEEPDGTRVFIGGVCGKDGWHYAVSTPVPEDAVLFAEENTTGPHATLAFRHPAAEGTPWVEHIIIPCGTWEMTLTEDGWAELFIPEEPARWEVVNTFCGEEEIFYHPDYLWNSWQSSLYGRFPLSLDVTQVDWRSLPLTFTDAMSLLDTTGFEDRNARWTLFTGFEHEVDPGLAAFVEAHLPGYSAWDGALDDTQAVLLADDAQGQRHFITGECTDGAWRFAISQPLPEGTGIDVSFYEGNASVVLYLPLPREKQNLYEGIRDIEVYVDCPTGGQWHITGVNTGMERLTFERHGISEDTGTVYYGDLLISTDPAAADWASLPHNWKSAMACVDTASWRIVSTAAADLLAEPGGTLLGRYFSGAPVRVLAEADGWLQVEPLGTDFIGWTAKEDTIPASEQLWQPWANDRDWYSLLYWDNLYRLCEAILDFEDPAITLYAMPHDGSTAAIFPVTHFDYLRLLGLCAEGCCYHVYHEETGASGWVPVSNMPAAYQDVAFVANHVPGYVLDFYYNATYMGEHTVMALVYEPGQHPQNGGCMHFMGAVLTDGEWQVTLSSPFPAGLWPNIDAYHAGDGSIAVSFMHPELFRQYFAAGLEDADEWADRHYVIKWRDGAWQIVSVGGEMADAFFLDDHAVCDNFGFEWHGDFTFSRDVTQTDWLAFPTTMEEVLAQTDSSQWSIIYTKEFLREEPQGESEILGEYLPGTCVRVLEVRNGWQRVVINGGSVTGWMETDALAVPDSAAFIAGLPLVKTGSSIVSVMGVSADGASYHAWDLTDGWEGTIPAADCTTYLGDVYWKVWPMNERGVLEKALRRGWVFLNERARLMTEPAPDALDHGTYRPGVWAEVTETSGEWSRIRIHGTAEGWVPASSLTSAADMTLLPQPPKVKLRMDEPAVQLYDAPEGNVISEYETDWPTTVTLLGNTGDGWYHVHDGIEAGYIRQDDCEGFQ